MAAEVMSPEQSAARLAEALCDVMNVTAILHNEPALHARDPVELRSALLRIVDEMTWVASIVAHGSTAGITWPPDADVRIERLRAIAGAWDPIDPPPPSVLDAARDCLMILLPTQATAQP
jgi:hypothetical protein